MTTAAVTTLRIVPVVLYLAVPDGYDPTPLQETCHRHARAHLWRVTDDVIDVVSDPQVAPRRRPGWRRVRELVVGGFARGILTYASPMVSVGRDAYADVEEWAMDRACFLAAVWAPRQGDLVRDTITGRTGVFQAGEKSTAWLRPPGGGREWTTVATALTPDQLPVAVET